MKESSEKVSSTEEETGRWLIAVFLATAVMIAVLVLTTLLYWLFPGIIPHHRRAELRSITNSKVHTSANFFNSCHTEACDYFRQRFLSNLSLVISPCRDLQRFSCSADKADKTSSQLLRERLIQQASVQALLSTPADHKENQTAIVKTALFYKTCVGQRTPADLSSLRNLLRHHGLLRTVPPFPNPLNSMLKMAASVGLGVLIELNYRYANSSRNILRSPVAFIELGLNQEFKRWAKQANRTNGVHTVFVASVHALVLPENTSNEDAQRRTAGVALTDELVHNIWTNWSMSNKNADSLEETIAVGDLKRRSKHLSPDALINASEESGIPVTKEDRLVLKDRNVLHFLDALLDSVDMGNVTKYLAWEMARQLFVFFNPQQFGLNLALVCHKAVRELFGSAATLLYSIIRSETSSTMKSAETIFDYIRRASVATMAAVIPQDNQEKRQLSFLTDIINTTRLSLSYPDGVENPNSLDDKLSSFADTGPVFFDNYLSALTSILKLRRAIDQPVRGSATTQVIAYDSLSRQLTLPVEYLLPPLYAADSFLSANYGTLGIDLSIALWKGVVTAAAQREGGSSVVALQQRYAKRFGCNLGNRARDHDDFIVALAGEVVAEAFATCCREMSVVPSLADIKLLFLASCLPSCGSVDALCSRATLCSVQFRQAFQCPM